MKSKSKLGAKELKFGFVRRRVKKNKTGEPICPDYKKGSLGLGCVLEDKCKNATFLGTYSGTCSGGTKLSEIEYRKGKYLEEAK